MAEQPAVETEQGKQVLVAKCAFSEQRNDSNVLASVVTGTLPRAELTEKPTAAAAAAATPAFMNGVPFPLMEEGFYFSKWTWQQTRAGKKYEVIVRCVY